MDGLWSWVDDPTTNWAEVTAWATVVLAVTTGLLVFGAFAAGRYARKTIQSQTATYFSRRWDEDDMLETRNLLAPFKKDARVFKKAFFALYDGTPDDHLIALKMLRQANYLEDLAILTQDKTVARKFVAKSLGYIVVSRWKLWVDVADELQKRAEGIDNYPAFRRLADDLKDDPDLA